MIDKNTVYIGQMLENLTSNIAMTAAKINSIQKTLAGAKLFWKKNMQKIL